MKKRIFSAALCLLLLLSLPASAFADVLYPGPGDVEAGTQLEHLAATVAPESSVSAAESTLPDGVNVETAEAGEGLNIYLRGVPDIAGFYNCVITVAETSTEAAASTLTIPVHVTAATPELTVSDDVFCYTGDWAELRVDAYANDGASLSYQWYASADGSTNTSILISGATEASFQPSTDSPGVYQYYCVVTNYNNGELAEAVSPVMTVTVQEMSVTGVELENVPYKLVYSLGDSLAADGLRLRVTYSDGSVRLLDEGYSVSPSQLNLLGEQEITVSYQGYSCSFTVTVEQEEEEVITGIGILSLPWKTSYLPGEALDTAGLSIRVQTNKGYRDVDSGLQVNPTWLDQSGTQTITVYYEGFSCTFSVQVAEEEKASSLTVLQMPTKTSYLVGDTLDVSGLILRQTTNRNNTEDIYYGFTVSPNRLDRPGRQEITVSYNGLSCAFHVNVSQPVASPSPTVAPTPTPTVRPTATPVPSVRPTVSPSPGVPSPSPTPQSGTAARQASMARTLIAVILLSAILALGVLGVYLFVANRGGFEEIADRISELFRRRK